MAELAIDIALMNTIDAAAGGYMTYVFNVAADAVLTLSRPLDAINLGAGSSLTINGNGATLDGGGTNNGLFVDGGTVSVDDLTINGALAAAGGGSLQVAGPGSVTLSADNTYTAGITLTGGTLDLVNPHAVGSGAISFAAGDFATLQIGLGDAPANRHESGDR